MRKKIVIYLSIFIILFIAIGFLYYESLVTSIAISQLNSMYGLGIDFHDSDLSLFSGEIVIQKPQLYDINSKPSIFLADAASFGLGVNFPKMIRGIVEITHFQSRNTGIELRRLPKGDLNWARVIQRFVPDNRKRQLALAKDPNSASPAGVGSKSTAVSNTPAVQSATPIESATSRTLSTVAEKKERPAVGSITNDVSPSMEKRKPPKFPEISIQNARLNLHDDNTAMDHSSTVLMDRFHYDTEEDSILIEKLDVVLRPDSPSLLNIEKLDMENVLHQEEEKLNLTASNIEVQGKEIDVNRYDFSDTYHAWMRVYREIGSIISPKRQSDETLPNRVNSLLLKSVTINVAPKNVDNATAGAIRIHFETLEFQENKDLLTVTDVRIEEDGRTVFNLPRLVFSGVNQRTLAVKEMKMSGLQIDIREDGEGNLNVARTIQQIRNILQSFIPEKEKMARVMGEHAEKIENVTFNDAMVFLHSNRRPEQKAAMTDLFFHSPSHTILINQLKVFDLSEENLVFEIPSLLIEQYAGGWKHIKLIQLDRFQAESDLLPDGLELTKTVADWIAISDKLGRSPSRVVPSTAESMYRIDKFLMTNATLKITDKQLVQPISHRLESLNLDYKDLQIGRGQQNPWVPVNLNAKIAAPGQGRFSIYGKVIPTWNPLNLNATMSLSIQDMMAYQSYFRGYLPVGLEKSGFRLNGILDIRFDHVESTFDMYLDQPVFSTAESKWPAQIDTRTAISALNGMKDNQGTIAFRNNKLEGEFRDPTFNFGTGISQILGRNLMNRTLAVLKLPLNVVDTGASLIKKGAGSVGNVMKKIFDGEENP